MLSLYKLKNKFLILLMMIVSSCSIISDDLSCTFSEIDCYRFNYSSIEDFRDSVTEHASKWNLKDPSDDLSNLTINKELSIKSSNDAEELIDSSLFIVKLDKASEGSFKFHFEACSVTESLKSSIDE